MTLIRKRFSGINTYTFQATKSRLFTILFCIKKLFSTFKRDQKLKLSENIVFTIKIGLT